MSDEEKLIALRKTIKALKKTLKQIKKGEITLDEMNNEKDTDSDEIDDIKQGGKDVKLASSVTEEGGDSDVSTSCGTDHNANAAMTEDEFNDKWKDEWDDTPPSFECIPWHDDMPEFVEEELDELEETKEEMSPPKRKNRWS